jgi:Putative serine esterase (DUF676)
MKPLISLITLICLVSSCTTGEAMNPNHLDSSRLPTPNKVINIPGLGPCTDNPDRSLNIDSHQPLTILVHGCFSSSGQFRALAQVFAFHGQQAACFTYDHRAKLTKSGAALSGVVQQIAAQTQMPQITVIGHSQGALVARNSLTNLSSLSPFSEATTLRLVTVSGPFAGIESARTCGNSYLYPLTLGMIPLSCYLVTGAKWTEITYSSRFIREPSVLARPVLSYLKIDTDEQNSCRKEKDGRCLEDDNVFSLAEQRNSILEADSRTHRLEVTAGHVEIVGNKNVAPTKLIATLQDHGILNPTSPKRQSDFSLLLSQLY